VAILDVQDDEAIMRKRVTLAGWCLGLLLLSLPLIAQTPPAPIAAEANAAAALFIDDEEFTEEFTEKLQKLAAMGKCIPADVILQKIESDHPFALTTTAPGKEHLTPEAVYQRAMKSVWMIGCIPAPKADGADQADALPDDAGWFATAWTIAADGVLVTNWHVFDKSEGMAFGVVNSQGEVYPILEILACDKLADLAVFRIAAKGLTPLPVATASPIPGAWVGVLSHPGNQPFTFTQGQVTRYTRNFGGLAAFGEQWMGITADYAGGSSGGPVIDRMGAVVGMACLTTNIDHDESASPQPVKPPQTDEPVKPEIKPEGDSKDATMTSESRVQMIVKLVVPLPLIRQIVSVGAVPQAKRPIDLAAMHHGLLQRFEKKRLRLEKQIEATDDEMKLIDLEAQIMLLDHDYATGLAHIARTRPDHANALALLIDLASRAEPLVMDEVLTILGKHHLKRDQLVDVTILLRACNVGGKMLTAPAGACSNVTGTSDFLELLAKESPHRVVRSGALYTLGLLAKSEALHAEGEAETTAIAKANQTFQKLIANPAEITLPGDEVTVKILANRAMAGLKALPDLKVGKTAPDLIGVDLAGKPMKLSESKNRVVLISTWSSTSDPSLAIVPNLKQLLKKHQKAPFTIVGINGDEADADVEAAVRTNSITWRSFRNEVTDDKPGIIDRWNITSFPMLMLIDHKGVIRQVWEGSPGDEVLETEIQRLLDAMTKTEEPKEGS